MVKVHNQNGQYSQNSDNATVCPICDGMGIVGVDVPVGHPDFGKAFPCVCQTDKIKTRRTNRLRNVSNLDAFADKTFANFEIDFQLLSEDQEFLREACAKLDKSMGLTDAQRGQVNRAAELAFRYAEEPEGWLLLQGSYGTGKTHLAAAIANRRLDLNYPVLFMTVPDVLDYLRATFGPSSEVAYDERFEQLRTAPLLILDDLGAESQTAWAQEKLYQLLDYRHTRRMPTVVTSNADPQMLEARIRSRLLDQDLTRVVPLNIPDKRSPISTWLELDLTNLDRYRDMTFDTFDPREDEELPADDIKNLARIKHLTLGYAENPKGWLVLTGEPGCGKTHLAAAIARACSQRGEHALFVSASDLLNHLRATFNSSATVPYDKRLEEIKTAAIVILDDFTLDRFDKTLSQWARERLYEILIYRFDQNLPVVITTIQKLQEMDARLQSRVKNKSRSRVEAITAPYYPGKRTVRRAAPPRAHHN